jgi:Zn-dependent protease
MFALRPWRIGKVFGIPIGIDPSWLIIFALLTYQLATLVFPFQLELGRRRGFNLEPFLLAILASLLLFASVLAHELSHAWMALRRGVPVLSITLFIFGGVAQIGDEPDRPATEFLIAVMGPLMSLVLAILFAIFWIWPSALSGFIPGARSLLLPISVLGAYLAQTNVLLVLFNLLPGFPLDGGRVLRAALWAGLHSQVRATFIAMVVGRIIAGLIAAAGIFITVRGDFSGLWPVLVGWFLWQASGESYRSVLVREMLRGVTVGRLMFRPVEHVASSLNLRNFVDQYLLRQRAPVFAVEDGMRVVGFIGPEQIKRVPQTSWTTLQVRDAMLSLSNDTQVTPDDTVLRALQLLTRRDGNELAVVEGGDVVGIIGREEIARYLQWKGH